MEASVARSGALYNLVDSGICSDMDLDGYPRIALYKAFGFNFDPKADKIFTWHQFRKSTTPEMVVLLKQLAGPHGYAILKAMIAKREQEKEDGILSQVTVENVPG